MDDSRFLQCLSADYGDLRDAATAVELTAPVPSCPGWTVSETVSIGGTSLPALSDYTDSGQLQQRVLAIAGVR